MKRTTALLTAAALAVLAGCTTIQREIDRALDRLTPPPSEQPEEPTPTPEPTPEPTTGSQQFLWKPVSESNGRLVVLLPFSFRGNIARCLIATADGTEVETGSFAGDTHNGNRPHYRFSKPGAGYGTNIQVVVQRRDGTRHAWAIPDGARRVTK